MLTAIRVIPDFGRRAVRVMREVFSRRRVFRPRYGDEQFIDFLIENSPAYSDFHAASQSASSVDNRLIVERFFRTADRPIFFFERGDVRAALERIQVHYPDWREGLVARVQEQTIRSSSIYGRREHPLGPDFPWGGIEPGPGGDKLYRKQPHRWAFAPNFALAVVCGALTPGDLSTLLRDWTDFAESRSNGIAFDSNLAVIQRLVALTWAWFFLASRDIDSCSDDRYIEFSLLKIIQIDISFLSSRIGDSYPNNHLLGDFFVGWFVGFVWPELVTADVQATDYGERFLEEIERQVLRDGTSFEHSTHYHEFACEMLVSYTLLQRCNGRDMSAAVSHRLRRMLEFQIYAGGAATSPLGIGDATEETFIALGASYQKGPAVWQEIFRELFGPQEFPSRAGHSNAEPAFWMLGGQLPPTSSTSVTQPAASTLRSFPDGGFYVLEGTDPDVSLMFRTGPAPDQSGCAGHMHADLMSLYLAVDDVGVITDAGTYTYRSRSEAWPDGSPQWRRYFAGPRAHNSLAIGEHDPFGTPAGDFRAASIELHAVTRRIVESPICQWVEAELSGRGIYSGYRRGIVRSPGDYWLVYDVIPAAADAEERDLGLQFSGGAEVVVHSPTRASVFVSHVALGLDLSNGLVCSAPLVGSTDPIAGWVSGQYGVMEAAPQLRLKISQRQRLTAFIIRVGADSETPFPVEVQAIESGVCILVDRGGKQDVWLIRTADENQPIVCRGFEFDGELLWLQKAGSRILNFRWVNARNFTDKNQGLSIRSQSVTESLDIQFDGRVSRISQRIGADVSISWDDE